VDDRKRFITMFVVAAALTGVCLYPFAKPFLLALGLHVGMMVLFFGVVQIGAFSEFQAALIVTAVAFVLSMAVVIVRSFSKGTDKEGRTRAGPPVAQLWRPEAARRAMTPAT
jgi:hypothetical protein